MIHAKKQNKPGQGLRGVEDNVRLGGHEFPFSWTNQTEAGSKACGILEEGCFQKQLWCRSMVSSRTDGPLGEVAGI